MTINNQKRGDRCRQILKAYSDDDTYTKLCDFLADAMHWCGSNGHSFEDVLDRARMYFEAEIDGNDELAAAIGRNESAQSPVVRFPLGELLITKNASERLTTQEVVTALRRHTSGDWGDLRPEIRLANDTNLQQGGRLFSAYGQGEQRFWIITEGDRSVTHLLLSSDYWRNATP